jgi:hypothetical protein
VNSPTPAPKTDDSRKNRFSYGAFAVSIIAHGGLLLLIGGVVLVHSVTPKIPFTAEYTMESAPTESPVLEETSPGPPSTPNLPSLETAAPISSAQDATPIPSMPHVLTTSTPSASLFNSLPSAGSSALQALSGSAGGGGAGRSMSSLFGNHGQSEGGLVGYLYDLKQTSDKKPTPVPYTPEVFDKVVGDFIRRGWNEKVLEPYYKGPEPMTTYQICIPQMSADEAPRAFQVEKDVQPRGILVCYRGLFTSPKSGTFRFAGNGDDILYVRLDGSMVLGPGKENPVGNGKVWFTAGPWFNLREGAEYNLEVLIGERPGGLFHAFLLIEEKDSKPELDPATQTPILPVFQTSPTKLPSFSPSERNPRIQPKPFVCKP